MVTFNELRIDNYEDKLIIDCQIASHEAYANMYIESASLYYYKKTNASGEPESQSAVMTIFDADGSTSTTNLRQTLSATSLNRTYFGTDTFNGGIFYVKVVCGGELAGNTSEYSEEFMDTEDIATVVDWQFLYAVGMPYIVTMSDSCITKCHHMSGMELFIAAWFGLRLALSTQDYTQIEKMWDRVRRIYGELDYAGDTCGCN